jgi:protein-S-isoprenylcysteine O-methyltransferase Ste14
MHRVAVNGLMACWAVWGIVFFLRLRRMRGRQADVTAPAARWGMILQGLGYFLVWLPAGGERPALLSAAGLALGIFGVLTTWFALPALGKQWRVQAGLFPDHELVRSGPYRILRHPIYASMLAMFLANALTIARWEFALAGLVLFIPGIEIRVRTEDRLLESRFGNEFRAYRAATPAYLPFVR